MEGIIHIVAIYPRELWIEGKDVKRMCKFPPMNEWNGTLMKIYYEDGHEDDINEPVLVEIIGQKPKGVEVETETPSGGGDNNGGGGNPPSGELEG